MVKNSNNNMFGFMPQDMALQEIYLNQAMHERTIMFVDEFDRDSCYKAIYFLERIEKQDDKANIPMNERKPITIKIDSYGGMCYHCLGLISTIERLQDRGYQVDTEVFGVAMSCGFMLSIVGSNRAIARYGYLMCHVLSSWTEGQLQTMIEDVTQSSFLWESMVGIILRHTKITREQLEEVKKGKIDWYINAKEALELGCADKIK